MGSISLNLFSPLLESVASRSHVSDVSVGERPPVTLCSGPVAVGIKEEATSAESRDLLSPFPLGDWHKLSSDEVFLLENRSSGSPSDIVCTWWCVNRLSHR